MTDLTAFLLGAIGPIIGGFLALLGAFTVYYLTNKSNERRFQRQLNHQDSKTSLRKLHELLESKVDEPYNWADKITDFINSFDGTFLPPELKRAVLDRMHMIRSRAEDLNPAIAFSEEDFYEDQNALYGT